MQRPPTHMSRRQLGMLATFLAVSGLVATLVGCVFLFFAAARWYFLWVGAIGLNVGLFFASVGMVSLIRSVQGMTEPQAHQLQCMVVLAPPLAYAILWLGCYRFPTFAFAMPFVALYFLPLFWCAAEATTCHLRFLFPWMQRFPVMLLELAFFFLQIVLGFCSLVVFLLGWDLFEVSGIFSFP